MLGSEYYSQLERLFWSKREKRILLMYLADK